MNLESEFSREFLNTIFAHLPPQASAAPCGPHPSPQSPHYATERRHLGLFGCVYRLHPEAPMTSALTACSAASDDTPPQRGWRRPRGRRRISWLHRIFTDLNLPSSDAILYRFVTFVFLPLPFYGE